MTVRSTLAATRRALRLKKAVRSGLESLEQRTMFDSTVVFNEINYRPPGIDSDTLEWVEIHNQMAVNVDLSGWKLSSGIDYTFPNGTIIQAGKDLVIASNPAALQAATGFAGALSTGFTGQLSNSGEKINLKDKFGKTMDSVSYDTKGDWPVAPDGSGLTLAKVNPNFASDKAKSWAASVQLRGTPGAGNFANNIAPASTVVFNEIVAGANGFVEIKNVSNTTQSVGNFKIHRSGATENDFTITQPFLAPGEILSFTSAQLGFTVLSTDKLFLVSTVGNAPIDGVAAPTTIKARDASGRYQTPNAPTPGAANTFSLRDEIVINEIQYKSQPTPGTPANVQLFNPIGYAATGWKYNQSGQDLGTTWLQANYDDSGWLTGQGVFTSGPPNGGNQTTVPIPGVFTTGRNAAGTANGTVGTQDTHWTVKAPGAANAVPATIMTGHPAWAANDVNSQWIGTVANGQTNIPAGDYLYTTTFDLNGLNPTGAQLNMNIWADNQVVDILINGQSTGITAVGFAAAVARTLSTGFVSGVNTLQFVMRNDGPGDNPGAFRVLMSGTATVVPTNTQLGTGPNTYYFRKAFDFDGDPSLTKLQLGTFIDDGAVFYLNGVEVYRQNMNGAVNYNSSATGPVGTPTFASSTVLTIPPGALKVGNNVLQVEVHQAQGDTTDVAMGVAVTLTQTTPAIPFKTGGEEWIELYNKSDHAVDLSGWKLNDAVSYKFPVGTTLGAGQYLVVTDNKVTLAAKYPSITIAGNYSGGLSGKEDNIELLDPTGNVADEVHYFDDKPWPQAANGGGSTLELKDPNSDNSKPESWADSSEGSKSGWKTYSYTGVASNTIGDPELWKEFVLGLLDAGEVLLDDIVVTDVTTGPAQLLQNGTFENPGTSPVAWRVIGDHKGSVIVDPTNPANHVLRLVATGATEHMHNHAETTLANSAAVVNNHTYTISYRAKWISGSNQLNTRLYFNRVARTTPIDTPKNNGTPGAANTQFVANAGPTFDGLKQDVVFPSQSQAVNVSVNVADNNGLAASNPVKLYYAVSGGAWQFVNMTTTGGGAYTGQIPGQFATSVVQFYVEATDALGATATYPAAGTASRALYYVNNASATLPPGTGHQVRVIMTAADAALMHNVTNVMSNDTVRATVLYDEPNASFPDRIPEIFYDVRIKLQSSERGRADGARVGFDINFNADHLFRGVQSSITLDRSSVVNSFASANAEILLKHMLNAAGGLPSNYTEPVKVVAPASAINSVGLLLMDPYDNEYLDEAFENGSDGSVHKLELIYYPQTSSGGVEGLKLPTNDNVVGLDIRNIGTDKELYRWHYLTSNNRDEDNFGGVMRLANALSLTGPALEAAAKQTMDVDEWMRLFALESLGGVNDAYGFGLEHNLKMFERPSDGKMVGLQWDWDFAFNKPTNNALLPGNTIGNVAALPTFRHEYLGTMRDLIQTVYNTNYMTSWINHYGAVAGTSYSSTLTYIAQRVAFVNSQLPPQVAYAMSTLDNQTVNTSTIQVNGTGWIDVKDIFVRGTTTPLDVTWAGANVDQWSAQVPVYAGQNTLLLDAYDFQGNLIGTKTLHVTSTANLPNLPANLRITELNYNPAPSPAGSLFTDQDYEFVEFKNFGSVSINLQDAHFTSGLEFTFGNTTLAPGEVGVIVANEAAFRARYGPSARILGVYAATKSLDNGGDHVVLLDSTNAVVADFRYDDDVPGGWYLGTDGGGSTLEVVNPATSPDLSLPANWRASVRGDGTPGGDDTVPTSAPVIKALGDKAILTWSPVTGASTYNLYRSTTAGGTGATLLAGGVANTTYTDETAIGGNTYYYYVTANLITGEGAKGGEGSAYVHMPGDANDDLTVDFNDLVLLAQNYNTVGGMTWAIGDFTGDGTSDFEDLIIIAQNYNTTRGAPGAALAASQPIVGAAPMPAMATVIAQLGETPTTMPPKSVPPVKPGKPVVVAPPKPVVKKPVAKPIVKAPVKLSKPAATLAIAPPFSTKKIVSTRKVSDVLA